MQNHVQQPSLIDLKLKRVKLPRPPSSDRQKLSGGATAPVGWRGNFCGPQLLWRDRLLRFLGAAGTAHQNHGFWTSLQNSKNIIKIFTLATQSRFSVDLHAFSGSFSETPQGSENVVFPIFEFWHLARALSSATLFFLKP